MVPWHAVASIVRASMSRLRRFITTLQSATQEAEKASAYHSGRAMQLTESHSPLRHKLLHYILA